ncbi:MAG: FCSD flavin-binding domain-containing protein [Gammaproteobacteria bacterium]
MKAYDRRDFLKVIGAAGAVTGFGSLVWPMEALAAASGKVVVVGGGFGGATCARYLKRWGPKLDVTLVERDTSYITCPFSNEVLSGNLDISKITHDYSNIHAQGINVVHDEVTAIDAGGKSISLKYGGSMKFDKLVVSPGIAFRWGAIENDQAAVQQAMPHSWKAGEQTLLLRKQLQAMRDGGTVIIVPPKKPFRCPPGPYERASLIAHYLKWNKPKSKILIIDANPSHSKQAAFHEGWNKEYGNMIEWIKDTDGGVITSADPGNMTLRNDFGDEYKGDVINLIPYQKAGELVETAGLTNKDGWCTVDMGTFESAEARDVHVIGDACVAGAMPKSGHSAASQAKNCAAAIVSMLAGDTPPEPTYANTCYSLIGPKYGISVAAVYRLKEGVIVKVSGGVSKVGNRDRVHENEAKYARGWYKSITSDVFG